MFYCTALLLLAATADVFGYNLVNKSPQVGVLGGEPVAISAVPYMADLRRGGYHFCAATIVHQKFVLTAAHCILADVTYTVAVGSEDIRGGIVYDVDNTFIPELYHTRREYDIALVKVNKEITFGPTVKNIELAAEPLDLMPGMVFSLTGWGRTVKEHGESLVLRQVFLPFMAQTECNKIYDNFLTDKELCAGELDDGKGPCYADGGSPLVLENTLVGIVASGMNCGKYPAVYTKISAFEDWIRDTVEQNQ